MLKEIALIAPVVPGHFAAPAPACGPVIQNVVHVETIVDLCALR